MLFFKLFPSLTRPIFLILTILSLTSTDLFAKASDSLSLGKLIERVNLDKKNNLFVHFDKNVYVPNESIWFSAYLLGGHFNLTKADVLSVVLIKDESRKIFAQKKFIFSGLTSSGEMVLPDSLVAGNYTLLAYLNVLDGDLPSVYFTQPIHLKTPGVVPTSTATKIVQKESAIIPKKVHLKVYPEGGNLVNGLTSLVGFEACATNGKPLEIKALLLKDGLVVDTIVTSGQGMGSFQLTPAVDSKYEIQLQDSMYSGSTIISKPLAEGIVISTPVAVTHSELLVNVFSSSKKNLNFVVHNGQQTFEVFQNVPINRSIQLNIPLHSLPKGLALITAFDEDFTPISERVFFAHHDQPDFLNLKTDSAKYSKRKEVNLTLSIPKELDSAMVSVSVVHANRINNSQFRDISHFQFLTNELNLESWNPVSNLNDWEEMSYLENVLLIKGWRKYDDSSAKRNYTPFSPPTGYVTNYGKRVKKPMALNLIGDSNPYFFETQSDGSFELPNSALISLGKNPSLFALNHEKSSARIYVDDPNLVADSLMAANYSIINIENFNLNNDESIPRFRNLNTIEAVNIVRNSEEQYFNIRPGIRTNVCGDYVCTHGNVLNCDLPGHYDKGTIPIPGQVYHKLIYIGPGRVIGYDQKVYVMCEVNNKSLIRLEGIFPNKEFYSYTTKEAESDEMMQLSTLYWKNELMIKPGIESKISFFTGDIHGSFKIIVQGMTNNGVLSQQGFFEVRK